MKILAGIVLFNPDIKRLECNINTIINQVDKVLLIDNNSKNIDEIKALCFNNDKISIICNKENYGIAKALNQILNYSYENNFDWFLTLDQDSVSNSELISKYKEFMSVEKNIAVITCEYEDLNVELPKYNFGKNDYILVDFCITSGSLNNTFAIKENCCFDDEMFIDMVDYDYCTSLIENNLKIIKINFKGFYHEVGKSVKKKILFKDEIVFNHSPFRTYYITRNSFYYIKKHKKSINVLKWYIKSWKKILLILLFEKDKKEKFKNIIKGIQDSKEMYAKYRNRELK